MRIGKIKIRAFGRLADKEFDFSAGFNVVYGLNEAGKTTLMQSIAALLYGFPDSRKTKSLDEDIRRKYEPWDGAGFSGSLQCALEDGRKFQIERDFNEKKPLTQVFDLTSSRDATSNYDLGRKGNIEFAKTHLGISREGFLSTAFVSHGQIEKLSNSAEVGSALQSLTDTSSGDSTAKTALQKIDKLKKAIGMGERGEKLPLAVAVKTSAELEKQIEEIESKRRTLAEDLSRTVFLEEELKKLSEEEKKFEYLVILKKKENFDSRLKEIRSIESRLTQLKEERERLNAETGKFNKFRVLADWGNYEKFKAEFMKCYENVGSAMDKFRQAEAKLKNEVCQIDEMEALQKRFENVSRWSFEEVKKKDEKLKEKQLLIEEKRAILRENEKLLKPSPGLFVSIVLAFIGILVCGILIFTGKYLPWLAVPLISLAAGVSGFFYFKSKQKINLERLETLRTGILSLGEEENSLRKDFTVSLASYGFNTLEDFEKTYMRFLDEKAVMQEYLILKKDMESAQENMRKAREMVLQKVLDAGYKDATPEVLSQINEGIAGYKDISAGLEANQREIRKEDELKEMRSGGKSIEEMEKELTLIEGRLDSLKASNEACASLAAGENLEELERKRAEILRQKTDKEKEHGVIAERIRNFAGTADEKAELEEKLSYWDERKRKLELFRDALLTAEKFISESAEEVHRNFMPHLRTELDRYIGRITDGRYIEAFIDSNTFAVSVKIPGKETPMKTDVLSFGTREQIYLLLRIAISRLLSKSRERLPLILDDPFVHYDENRLKLMIAFMLEISKENQIILFTRDKSILSWVESHSGEAGIINL
ncbi:MAG: AAA family ATPase [Firmicutes bacterium]|nr:AAA family ATPase [Bacillota bacterium]